MQILIMFFRYWNDKDVLQKLGEAMGFAASGDATSSAENAEADETEEANEDESIVHQTASVGDVEVQFHSKAIFIRLVMYIFWEFRFFFCTIPFFLLKLHF